MLGTRNNIIETLKLMDVSKNPRIFEVDQRYVHYKARKMCRMKDVEVSVFDSMSIEIGRWIGFCL